jgi:hypothetical protein
MAAIDDLKAAWTLRLATIADAVVKAEATYLLDSYIAAMTKQAALEADTIQAYSIGGRSVTRRDASVGQSMINGMRLALNRYCYGQTTLVDLNTADESATIS